MTDDKLSPILGQLAASRHDEAGWEALYRELWPLIVATLTRRHGLPTVLADDLAQDVMIRLLKNARFERVSSLQFRAYVNDVCRSVAIDNRRKASRTRGEVPLTRQLSERLLASSPSSEVNAQLLLSGARNLGDFERTLLDKVLDGLPSNEIAEQMRVPVGTVHVWLHRLRKKLRQSLSGGL